MNSSQSRRENHPLRGIKVPECRVVLVTHYFSTHGGGVENIAIQTAKRVAERAGVQVTWFGSDCDSMPPPAPGLRFEAMRTWNALEQFGLPWPIWGLRSLLRLRNAISEATVVHMHDFIYFGSIAAFLIAKYCGRPIVITQHIGDIPYSSRFLSGLLKLINRSVGTFMLARANQVVFYSEVVRSQFHRSTTFRAEPVFWPNGVDTNKYFPVDQAARLAIRRRIGARPERPAFLFVGRFVEKKGLLVLRKLVESFKEIEWWILGWGAVNPDLDPTTWRLPNMKIFFDRSGAIAAELYQAADLLVLPSKGEGFPLVVQEAMACGTPAMVSSATAAADPSSRPLLLTCDLDGTANDFINARNVLLQTGQEKLASLRESAVQHALREWSWHLNGERYAALYTRLSEA